ncbi:MAG: hypothetical protein OXG24_01390 [Gammaproteobacteria bacterium]|nr:hypothetical protein [Gammaproteobacteria bacterium]
MPDVIEKSIVTHYVTSSVFRMQVSPLEHHYGKPSPIAIKQTCAECTLNKLLGGFGSDSTGAPSTSDSAGSGILPGNI